MELIEDNFEFKIPKSNIGKLSLYTNMNNNQIIDLLNNFFKIFNIIYVFENQYKESNKNIKINCITHFIGKIRGPCILLFDVEIEICNTINKESSIHLINKCDKSYFYVLKDLYGLLNKYMNNSISFNDFNNIFTFSTNKIKDSDIIQSLNVCHNTMSCDIMLSLTILLSLAHQAPDSCLDEIDNLFKLLSTHISRQNENLISQYIVVILSILSNHNNSTNKLLFYFDIRLFIRLLAQ